MNLLKVGLAAVLLPAGIVLAVAGFLIDIPVARTPLQVFGMLALAGSALLGQRLVNDWQKMLDQA